MKIKIIVDNEELVATLFENKTAKDLAKLLPLELRMDDLFNREKYGHLARVLSTESHRQNTYRVGDIGYWSPGADIIIYYRDDMERISHPGIIVIGKINSGLSALTVTGPISVRMIANELQTNYLFEHCN